MIPGATWQQIFSPSSISLPLSRSLSVPSFIGLFPIFFYFLPYFPSDGLFFPEVHFVPRLRLIPYLPAVIIEGFAAGTDPLLFRFKCLFL